MARRYSDVGAGTAVKGIWDAFFSWPSGGVWSNLLASLIVGVALYFWKGRAWVRKAEIHRQKIHELHAKLVKGETQE